MKRCDACKGKKDIVGLGMIAAKCSVCNGIGYKLDIDKNVGSHDKQFQSNKSKRK